MMRLPFVVAVVGLFLPTVVTACGGFFCRPLQPVVQSAETIAFGVQQAADGAVAVTMKVQIQYDGPTESFSWILPMPAVPKVSVGTDVLFAQLMEATNPTFEVQFETVGDAACQPEILCSFGSSVFFNDGEDEAAAVVLEEGSVGPFDYVIIEAADADDTDAAYRWLNDNGYDQPELSGPLLNYYSQMEMKFLALKLSKNNDAGDIQPIVLEYTMPNKNIEEDALACVPIQLTAVASAAALPVQVFLLGPHRGVPVNYLEAELDLQRADWLGCNGSPNCFLNDHRARANAMFRELQGKAFTTEFSGPTTAFSIQLVNVDIEAYQELTTPDEYLRRLANDMVPYTNQVHGIVTDFIEGVTRPEAGSLCSFPTITFTFPPSSTRVCLDEVEPASKFDPVALTERLNTDVFQPLQKDEEWILSHAKMTRMYGNFGGPDDMTKDPFFAFDATLPDVSNIHRVTASPECVNTSKDTVLRFTVEGKDETFSLDAQNSCGGWTRANQSAPLFGPTLPTAKALIARGFSGSTSRSVALDGGVFSKADLETIETMLDARVPNQTIPEWSATVVEPMAPSTSEPNMLPTSAPVGLVSASPTLCTVASGTIATALVFWVLSFS